MGAAMTGPAVAEFIEAIWGNGDALIELRCFSDGGEKKKPLQYWYTPEELARKVEPIAEWAMRQRIGVFAGVLPRKRHGGSTSADTVPARVVWADVDFKDYKGGESEARERLEAFHKPSAIVRSGNGLHAYWLLNTERDPELLSTGCRMIAGHLGADMASTDPARVLRLPGTYNAKKPEPKAVEVEYLDPAVVYKLSVLIEGLPEPRKRITIEDYHTPIEYKPELSAELQDLLFGDERLKGLLRNEGKPHEGPDGQPLDTSTAGYDWSLLRELVWHNVTDETELASALAHKITLDERREGKKSSRDRRYVVRTVHRLLASDPPQKSAHKPDEGNGKRKGPPSKEQKGKLKKRARPRSGCEPTVWDMLELGQIRPLNNTGNIVTVLRNDTRLKGRLWWDMFRDRACIDEKRLDDIVLTELGLWLETFYGIINTPRSRLRECVDMVAFENRRHVVRDYLDGLVWDGEPRLNGWLRDYLGGHLDHEGGDDEDLADELLEAMGRKFLVSCVARAFEPGCKVDTMLILIGPQGAYKSTAFKVLAGQDWFSDSDIDLRTKDKYQVLAGAWIFEIAELDSFRRADQQAIKAFVSSSSDTFRPTGKMMVVERPRQCVFVGTTNEAEFLADKTGSRRFWLVKVGDIDLESLKADRDQLWAEAVAWYKGGEKWYLDRRLERVREEKSEPFKRQDAWQTRIEEFIATKSEEYGAGRLFHITEVLTEAIEKPLDRINGADTARAGGILQMLGCTKKRSRLPGGKRATIWSPPDE